VRPKGPGPDVLALRQAEAAALIGVSVRFLRSSDCPKLLLPGRGRRKVVRYDREVLEAWLRRHSTSAEG
jgi:hypothetical protein